MSKKMFPEKEDPFVIFAEALMGGSSSDAIKRQEAREQKALVNSETLPHKFNYGTREQFEQMGIVFGEKADDLFSYVTLPNGWKKQPTDHSMWSKLVDEQGRERALIFYKAAFYDCDAFLSISRRYTVSTFESTDADGNIVERDKSTNFSTYILDAGKPLKLIAVREKGYGNPQTDKDEAKAFEWINKHYPDHKNPLAYW